MRLSLVPSLVVAAVLAVPAITSAQDVAPTAGSWGAEASAVGDVSLLRFRSSTSAWLVGFSGFYNRRDEDDSATPFEATTTVAAVRLGWRGYRAPESRTRPFTTLAALVGYDDTAFGATWQFGGQFEYGAAYFFTRHVSLGASFDLRAVFGVGEREQPFDDEIDVMHVTLSTGLRFLGAVYF